MSHMLSSLQVRSCWETKMSVVPIKVVSLRTKAVKLHKNFYQFRYSLRVNKKKHLGRIFFLLKAKYLKLFIYTLTE